MSFNEKLQILRKRDKLSQEQLADMLDVTRQSVSKWESGTTYPEMDKLIALCKIFKCTLDDLTNDDIVDIEDTNKKSSKSIVGSIIDNVSEIIRKTIEMFRVMNAKQIGCCIFSMLVIGLILCILRIPFESLENNFYSLLRNLKISEGVMFISGFFNLILDITFYVLYVLIFTYIYKVAYLDRYNFIQAEQKEIQITLDKKEVKETKEVVVPVQTQQKGNTLFKMMGGIVIGFVKMLVAFCSLPVLLILFFLALGLVFSIYAFTQGIVFIGLFFMIISAIVLAIWIIELVCIFIFNKNASFKRLLWTFIGAVGGFGISCGIFILEISNLKFMDVVPVDYEILSDVYEYKMTDDFAIYDGNWYNQDIIYIEDETLEDKVKVKLEWYDVFIDAKIVEEVNNYYVYVSTDSFSKFKKAIDLYKSNLKDGVIYNYDKLYETKITIYTSSKNIDRIKKNNEALLEKMRFDLNSCDRELNEYQINFSDLESEVDELQKENDRLRAQNEELQEYKDRILGAINE